MFIFLTGKDDYAKHRRAGVLRSGFQQKYDEQANQIDSFVCGQSDLGDIRRAIQSGGLFQTKRFIELWQPSALKKEDRNELLEYVTRKDEDVIIVMIDDGMHGSTARSIKKKADKSEEFPEPSPKDMRDLAAEIGKRAGVTLDARAAEELALICGTDGWLMESNVLRLASIAKGKGLKTLTKDLIEANTLGVTEDNIFALTDALSAKNERAVLHQLDDQRKTGTHELVILSMLTKHVKTLLMVKETDGKGVQAHPFVIKKAREAVGRFSSEELHGLYQRLLHAEKQLKLSPPDPWSVLLHAIIT